MTKSGSLNIDKLERGGLKGKRSSDKQLNDLLSTGSVIPNFKEDDDVDSIPDLTIEGDPLILAVDDEPMNIFFFE